MNQYTTSLFILLAVTLLIQPVYAENITISFSDLNLGRNIDIEVYQPTGSGAKLVAHTNSTGTIELNPAYDYVFVIRPAEDVWFQNPLNTIELMKIQLPVALSYLLWGLVVVGGVYVVMRRL
jgi:hypothetical protein